MLENFHYTGQVISKYLSVRCNRWSRPRLNILCAMDASRATNRFHQASSRGCHCIQVLRSDLWRWWRRQGRRERRESRIPRIGSRWKRSSHPESTSTVAPLLRLFSAARRRTQSSLPVSLPSRSHFCCRVLLCLGFEIDEKWNFKSQQTRVHHIGPTNSFLKVI